MRVTSYTGAITLQTVTTRDCYFALDIPWLKRKLKPSSPNKIQYFLTKIPVGDVRMLGSDRFTVGPVSPKFQGKDFYTISDYPNGRTEFAKHKYLATFY